MLEQHGCTPNIASVSQTSVLVSLDRKDLMPLVRDGFGPRVQVYAENSKALISLVEEGSATFLISQCGCNSRSRDWRSDSARRADRD
jgi:hypothetical protein